MSRVRFALFVASEIFDDIIVALLVTNSLYKLLDLLFFWHQLLFQRADFLILLLFNSVDDIVFHFVKARFELAEAFVEDARHTHKQISDLLRHFRAERLFKLWLYSSDDWFGVPPAWFTERYESVMEFQNFSDNDLHFVIGLLTLALNNTVFIKYLNDSIMDLNNSLGYRFLYCRNFEFAIIFKFGDHINIIMVGLQEGQVRLDEGPG